MKKFISLIALSLLIAAPTASALTEDEVKECNSLAQSFGPNQKKIEAKVAERDVFAEETEAAGEAWENAENVRSLSADAAAEADELRATWERMKNEFDVIESELFELSRKHEANAARFNNVCVKD